MPTANLADIEQDNTPPPYLAGPQDQPQQQPADPSIPPLLARPETPANSASLDDATIDHDTLQADATNNLAKYNAGDPSINDHDAGMFKGIAKAATDYKTALNNEITAADNTPGWLRAGRDLIGGVKTLAGKASNFLSLGGKPEDWAEFGDVPKSTQDLKEAATGAAEIAQGVVTGVGKMPAVAANLVAGLNELTPYQALRETIPGPWQDEAQKQAAESRAVGDVLEHYANTGASDISRITGVSHDTAKAMIGENVAYMLLGPMGMEGTAEGVANGVRNATNAVGNVTGGLKWAAAKAAPTAVGLAKAATVDVALRKVGLVGGMNELVSTLAGFGGRSGAKNPEIANKVVQLFSDKTLPEITEAAAQQATKPLGLSKNQFFADALKQKAGTLQEAIDADLADMDSTSARRATDLASDGSYKHPYEDLDKEGQSLRDKKQQVQDLQNKAQGILARNDFQKLYDSAIQGFGNFMAHTAQGAAIGAGFAGANAPTGDTSNAVASGLAIGGILGAGAAPFASLSGTRALRISDAAKDLKNWSIKNNAVAGDMSDLSAGQKRTAYSVAGMVNKLGGNKVYLHPEDEMVAWGGQAPDSQPGSGFVDSQGNIHLNKADLPSGVAGHEYTHFTQQFQGLLGEMLSKASPDRMADFEKQYQDALATTGKTRFNSRKERDAEVGRLVLQHTPIELFYGGETGADVLGRMWDGMMGQGKTKFINGFNAPYTRADILAMKQRFYKAGELAKMTDGQIPRDAKPPEVSFTDFTDAQAEKFHRAVEFNQQQGMSPDAAFKDVADNIEFMPKPRPGQTKEEALDEAWERYYAQVQEQNAKREPQEQDFNTRPPKPKWYDPTSFVDDARMRSLLPSEQRPKLEPYVPKPKPFERTYGWMSPEGKYIENKSGNIHANTIAKELNGQDSFRRWRENVIHKGGDETIKNHPYIDAMEWAYRKGWEKGYVRLLNSGKTLYANIGKDFVISPEMKDHLIKRAEESGADRVMVDRDFSKTEKLWDNPDYAGNKAGSAYFGERPEPTHRRLARLLNWHRDQDVLTPHVGQPAKRATIPPEFRAVDRDEFHGTVHETVKAATGRLADAITGRGVNEVRTFTEHLRRQGKPVKKVSDMTPEEIRAELAARDAWNAREGWRGKPAQAPEQRAESYMPRKPGQSKQDAAQEAWERYYNVVQQQNQAAEAGQKMPSPLAITRRQKKLERATEAERVAAEAQRIKDRAEAVARVKAKAKDSGKPQPVYGWLKPDNSFLENKSSDIHADTISKELNPDYKYDQWDHKDEQGRYTDGDYTSIYGSMRGAYEAGWDKGYIRLRNSYDTLYAHLPVKYGPIPESKVNVLKELALENNMNEIIHDNGTSNSYTMWSNPNPVKDTSDYMPRIKSPAIQDKKTGKIYLGENHAVAYNDYLRATPDDKVVSSGRFVPHWDNPRTKEGFIDTDGNFHDRANAWQMAADAGQLTPSSVSRKTKTLFSEDLMPRLTKRQMEAQDKATRDYDFIQAQNMARDEEKKMPTKLSYVRRKNRLERADQAERDAENQRAEQARLDALSRRRFGQGNDRPREVYGWLSPKGEFHKNKGGDIHADTISRLLDPQGYEDSEGSYHDMYGGMTQAYMEGWRNKYLRLTSLGRQMYVHYPAEYGDIPKSQLGELEKIAMEHNMDVVLRDTEDGPEKVLWQSPEFGTRDDGLTSEYEFMPKARQMNDENFKEPFYVEKHGGVYAVVDRRKPSSVGFISPDLKEAQHRAYWANETERPKTSASGLWDSTFVEGEGAAERKQVAKQLGVQEDKHYWEQKPEARAKIKDYYTKQGADFMPRPTPLQVAEGVHRELKKSAEEFIGASPYARKFLDNDKDGMGRYYLMHALVDSVKGKPQGIDLQEIHKSLGMTPTEVEVFADGFRQTVNPAEIEHRINIGSLPAAPYPYDMNPKFEAQMRDTADQTPEDTAGEEWKSGNPPPGWNPREGGSGFWPREFMPRIRAAAVRDNDTGNVFEGRNHIQAETAWQAGDGKNHDYFRRLPNIDQGFVTDEGRFVSRQDGAPIAKASGQLKNNQWRSLYDKNPSMQLISEDVNFMPRMGVPVNEEKWREMFSRSNAHGYPKPIVSAAILDLKDGTKWVGKDHVEAYTSWGAGQDHTKPLNNSTLLDGFIDTNGDFLNRKQAGVRVGETGQMGPEASRILAQTGLDSQTFEGLRSYMPRSKETDLAEHAAKLSDGKIITGSSQGEVYGKLRNQGLDPDSIETGFVDGSGKFLNTGEAYHQAITSGQGAMSFMPRVDKQWEKERWLTRKNIAMLMGWPREDGLKKFAELSPNQQKQIAGYYGPKPGTREDTFFMPKPDDKRAIKEAAIQYPDGTIYAGTNHASAIINSENKVGEFKVGFVTNDRKFLDRKQAMDRAVEIGQISKAAADTELNRQIRMGISEPSRGLESWMFNLDRNFMPKAPAAWKVKDWEDNGKPKSLIVAPATSTIYDTGLNEHRDVRAAIRDSGVTGSLVRAVVNDRDNKLNVEPYSASGEVSASDMKNLNDLATEMGLDGAVNTEFKRAGGPSRIQQARSYAYMPPIRKAEARGNSREVSQEEYDHLAASGATQLNQLRQDTQSTEGMKQNWNDMLNQVYAETRKPWGGATINPATGRDIKLTSGRDVGPFAMSVKDEGQETISVPIDASQREFNDAMLKARHAFPQLNGKDHYLGVFRDDDKGTIDIDPVLVVDTPSQVERIGAYTHASGGAYDYATGNGYFPPHLDYMPRSRADLRKFQEEMAQNYPEAIKPTFQKDKEGNFKVDKDTGEFVPEEREYNLDKTPLYKLATQGIKDPLEKDKAYVKALAQKIANEYKQNWKNDPLAMTAKGWYTDLFKLISDKLGKDNAELFAQLLSTTSPGNFASNNFRFALEAMNGYLSGRYDNILKAFKEAHDAFVRGDLKDASGNPITKVGQFNKYIRDNNILALQASGKKLGKYSLGATYVLAGHFWNKAMGKKVTAFVKNISGVDLDNPTIDTWAARTAHRLSNEGMTDKPWRNLPMNESAIGDRDFDLAQAAYKEAANMTGVKPTDLQAIAWFGEKLHYGKSGWINSGPGAELGDFRPFLKAATPKGSLGELEIPSGLKLPRATLSKPKWLNQ
jgi:hypothetical protein